ncbi:MAG: DUF1801 domain-containing protein [Flavobacteriaceae bacterium]
MGLFDYWFWSVTLKVKTGREGYWFVTGFSPRKNAITLYLMCELSPFQAEIAQLGKVKTGKGCIYIKRLSDVSIQVLEQLIAKSVKITLEAINWNNCLEGNPLYFSTNGA